MSWDRAFAMWRPAYTNGAKPTNLVEKSPVEKFLAGSNADLVLPFGASIGGSYLYIFDKKGSLPGHEIPR